MHTHVRQLGSPRAAHPWSPTFHGEAAWVVCALLPLALFPRTSLGQVAEAGEQASASASGATAQPASRDTDQVTRTETGLLDVHVRDMEIATALELLSYQARANIVTSTSVTGRVSANLYGVTLTQALDAILTPSHYAFRVVGNTAFVGNQQEVAAFQPAPVTRIFRLRYLTPPEAIEAVRAVAGPDAKVVEGGGNKGAGAEGTAPAGLGGGGGRGGTSGETGGATGTDYLLVTARPDRLEDVARLLSEIDQRPKQVLIEATILRATLNEANQFGIDFMMLGGVDFQNVSGASNPAGTNLGLGALPAGRLQRTTINANTNFSSNVMGGGFTFGLIKNDMATFIRALEEVTDVVVVANPKIVSLNKQEGQVIVGRRDGYLTTTVTQTAAVQTVEYLETGTQLRFRPVINEDSSVRLMVHPKDSNGGLTAANLPFEETTEARTDILMNDGDTVLIGGLFRERTVGGRSQVPILGSIPGAGLLFGSTSDQTVREEVIILLTVHVLKETPAERDAMRRLLDDVERIRVGSRRGLVGSGRERLAQAYYHEALRKLDQGDTERALLNVRMTLNNQPKHLPAIKLKERLLNQRLWDDEGSRMRTFIWDLIGAAPEPDRLSPPFGRPVLPRDAAPVQDNRPGGPNE